MLLPYGSGPHGPSLRQHRHIRSIQPPNYGNITVELYPAHESTHITTPIITTYPFVESVGSYWNSRFAYGHYYIVNNPQKTVSVLEPLQEGGCAEKHRATAADTGAPRKCMLVINAGFFNTTDGACTGEQNRFLQRQLRFNNS